MNEDEIVEFYNELLNNTIQFDYELNCYLYENILEML